MDQRSKNKLLTGLVIFLLIANIATLLVFWMSPKRPIRPKAGGPKEFIIETLKLDHNQQLKYAELVKEHQQGVESLRDKVKESKQAFFDLLSSPEVTDSIKRSAAKIVSIYTEQIDLLTLDHFKKLRAICSPEQQKIFDGIIKDVIRMMAQPKPPAGPDGNPDDRRPPPR
jgi:hypothetical protein